MRCLSHPSPPFVLGHSIHNAFLVPLLSPDDRGYHVQTPKLGAHCGAHDVRGVSGSGIVCWRILLEHRSRPVSSIIHTVTGMCTHRPVSHDLNSILWSLLYRAKHYSLRQASGDGRRITLERAGRTSCPHDPQRMLPPGLVYLGQTSAIGFKCCLWILYVPYDFQGCYK